MKEFWNARYDTEDFAYGKSPNAFFREQLWEQEFGRLLLPAEGEGRDAVYAAKKGWLVHAFDYSEVAASKAVVFAHSEGVKFEYQIIDIENFETADEFYHLVSISFLHLPEKERINFHRKMINSILPGGKIITEYFSKKQIDKKTGGPQNLDMLYSVDELKQDFRELNILQLTEELVVLDNGNYHQDEAWVLRFVGQRPE